ncbi:MAG: hypothetical protein M1814_005758 [Vezdaea aestivalis]|nr:MAG: hypothetical protein M1814_005758 [Vezdaea aestivalis]
MSIPNAAIEKLFREIETQALQSLQQINVVKAQIAAKQRDVRLLELTTNEISTLADITKVYEGVGKMFVASPIPVVNKRLVLEVGELKSDVLNLQKKLHYLETTHKNSTEHMEKIFRSQGTP